MRGRRMRWAVVAAVALGGAAAFWLVRRARNGVGDQPISHGSRTARNLMLARIGTRAGTGFARHRARRVFASVARRDELDREFEIRTAAQVTEALGNMKGAMMKLGQMASYLDQGLPEATRQALAQLQQDAPPMSPELAAKEIADELGAMPEQIFREWDPEPIASASIGQVHRALTEDGLAVAVKVQYPGVDDAIGADLDNVDFLFNAMGLLFPGLDPEPIVEELCARLLEELDYRNEAANQVLFADYYDGHPHIHVPPVVDELSTGRVLTTELAEGVRFDEARSWSEEERNLAAETIYRYVFGSIYRLGVFNGDPHPGNYILQPGGRVTFLDYGLVKHFEDEVPIFIDMIDAMVLDRDPQRFREILEDVGLLRGGMAFSDDEVMEYFSHFYEFVLEDGEVQISQEYASETVHRFFDVTGPHAEIMKAANVPAGFVVVQRINLGLYAIFADLGAVGNWRRLAEELWPNVNAPPSTLLGEAHAHWYSSAIHP